MYLTYLGYYMNFHECICTMTQNLVRLSNPKASPHASQTCQYKPIDIDKTYLSHIICLLYINVHVLIAIHRVVIDSKLVVVCICTYVVQIPRSLLTNMTYYTPVQLRTWHHKRTIFQSVVTSTKALPQLLVDQSTCRHIILLLVSYLHYCYVISW